MIAIRKIVGRLNSYAFIFPAIVVLGLFLVYPVVWSMIASFKHIPIFSLKTAGFFQIPGNFVGLAQYEKVLHNPLFIKSLFNTFYFGIIFIPLTMFSSAALAILLNQGLKGTNTVRTLIFIPYIISVVSASLIFMFLFNGQRGLVNGVIHLLGLHGPQWLASPYLAMPVIAIMSSWKTIGYMMLIYLAGLQNIPTSLYEAADVDGASPWQKIRLITWPLLGRISLVVFILLLIQSLNIFQEVYVMTGGGPGDSTTTVPFLVYNEAFKYYRIGSAAAMSYILFIIVLAITIIQKKLVDKRLG